MNLAPVRRRLSPERAHSKGPPIGQTCALSLASARTLSRPARTVYGQYKDSIWTHLGPNLGPYSGRKCASWPAFWAPFGQSAAPLADCPKGVELSLRAAELRSSWA